MPTETSNALREQLRSSQRLLLYATEAGIEVDAAVRDEILRALADSHGNQPITAPASLLAASTKLAAVVRPVTADSLRACDDKKEVDRTVRLYRRVGLTLALIILPISLITFVTSSISESMQKDIEIANALAVKLSDQIGPPQAQPSGGVRGNPDKLPRGVREIDVIRDLQTFAGTSRAIDARARQLNWLMLRVIGDPFKAVRHDPEATRRQFELPSDLPDLSKALTDRISTYQEVRYFATSVRELISTFYGAIAIGILPVLYALLGAVAYLLRLYQQQIKSRTFTGSDNHVARFVIAAIGGGVVGLFKTFTPSDGASISPLAIAFLVGYATDVFFSFLDSFVHAFNRD
ncbi:MAG TPA: hypothetical protein VIY30_18340, partial [Burkholderiaceae bacterium]